MIYLIYGRLKAISQCFFYGSKKRLKLVIHNDPWLFYVQFYLNSNVNPDNTSIFIPLALGVLKVIEIV